MNVEGIVLEGLLAYVVAVTLLKLTIAFQGNRRSSIDMLATPTWAKYALYSFGFNMNA